MKKLLTITIIVLCAFIASAAVTSEVLVNDLLWDGLSSVELNDNIKLNLKDDALNLSPYGV
jgi:hypothetical protein